MKYYATNVLTDEKREKLIYVNSQLGMITRVA